MGEHGRPTIVWLLRFWALTVSLLGLFVVVVGMVLLPVQNSGEPRENFTVGMVLTVSAIWFLRVAFQVGEEF